MVVGVRHEVDDGGHDAAVEVQPEKLIKMRSFTSLNTSMVMIKKLELNSDSQF